MQLKDLKEALKDNQLSYSTISAAAMANIIPFANVELKMDEESLDYYYKINVEDLLASDMPNDELETLKSQGWSFSDDSKSLIVYLNNG